MLAEKLAGLVLSISNNAEMQQMRHVNEEIVTCKGGFDEVDLTTIEKRIFWKAAERKRNKECIDRQPS